MKKTLIALPILLATLLSACHDSNPLLTQPIKPTAKQVYNAEINAMQQSHLYDAMQNVYLTCLTNPNHYNAPFGKPGVIRCETFFKALHSELIQDDSFKSLTLDNVKDKAVAKRLHKALTNLFQTDGQSES